MMTAMSDTQAGSTVPGDDRAIWVRVCDRDGCVITAPHTHGHPDD